MCGAIDRDRAGLESISTSLLALVIVIHDDCGISGPRTALCPSTMVKPDL